MRGVGRPRVPDALADLRGRPGRRPPRNLVKPASYLSGPPEWLSPLGVEFWEAHAPAYARLGLLTELSAPAFALMADAWGDYRELRMDIAEHGRTVERVTQKGEPMGVSAPRAETSLLRDAFDRLTKLASEFGMLPASLSRIYTGPTAKPADPVDAYRAKRRSA